MSFDDLGLTPLLQLEDDKIFPSSPIPPIRLRTFPLTVKDGTNMVLSVF